MEKKLHRDEHHKAIGGVCAGLAEHFGTDVSVIRAVFLVSLLLKGLGLPVYIILWIVLPKKGFNFTPGVDYRVPAQEEPFNPFAGAPQSHPFSSQPFNPPPFNPPPFVAPPKKKASTFGLVFGVALIMIGGIFLLDELNLVPNWDFEDIFPIVLIVGGAAIIASGFKKKPWEKQNWHEGEAASGQPATEPVKEETESDNTPPTV